LEIARWRGAFELRDGVLTWRADPSRSAEWNAAWVGKPLGERVRIDGRSLSATTIAKALSTGRIDAIRRSRIIPYGMPEDVNVGQGALCRALDEARLASRFAHRDLTVLARQRDPFFLDTPVGHRNGIWLKVHFDRLLTSTALTHWRLHYVLVAAGDVIKPDGRPYRNTAKDYHWLVRAAAKAAKWLGYMDTDLIVDKRNDGPVIFRSQDWGVGEPVGAYAGLDLPAQVLGFDLSAAAQRAGIPPVLA
jgi:hypothetical protein